MNRKQLGAYVVGVLTILGGACVGKYLLPEAAVPLIAAGAWWIGKVQRQPHSMRAHPDSVGAKPTDNV